MTPDPRRVPPPPLALCMLAALVTGALFLLALPPWLPALPESGLDSSWVWVLNYAHTHGWQFGRDLVFTFGPYGFLYSHMFDPSTFGTLLAFWCVLALAITASVLSLLDARRPFESALVVVVILVGLQGGALNDFGFNDAVFFLVPLLLVLVRSREPTAWTRTLAPLLVVLSALIGMVKFTFAAVALPPIVLADLLQASRGRRVPYDVLLYLAASVGFYLLAGQDPAHLPAFLEGSLAVVNGYSAAMQNFGSSRELIAFVVVATAFLTAGALAEWSKVRNGDWRGVAVWLALAGFVFVVFKAGFVRHDYHSHSKIAWSGAAAAFALYATHLVRLLPGVLPRVAILAGCVLVAGAGIALHGERGRDPAPLKFVDDAFGSGLIARARGMQAIVTDPHFTQLRLRYDEALAAIRSHDPLAPSAGTVDIYPWDAAIVLANGLDYRPRPIFQSFAVYNERLIAINRAHLNSERAAQTIVFRAGTIDRRFLPEDEGASWPDLLEHYDLTERQAGHLVLQRRATPRAVALRDERRATLEWGKPLAVPNDIPRVWLTLDVQPTWLGRVANVLFKPPVVWMGLTFADGSQRSYRLVPGIARTGFLLSPAIESTGQFAELFAVQGGSLPSGKRVVALAISASPVASDTQLPTWFYRREVPVTFSALAIGSLSARP